MKWFKRVFYRYSIISSVATHLGADTRSIWKMLVGGAWLLFNDSWKSKLSFSARIAFKGKYSTFYFEEAGDFELLHEIFLKGSYDFATGINTLSLIIDLGANIGVATLYFALLCPDAKIHSVEPDPANFRRLQKLTQSFSNVVLHSVAIWAEGGTFPFYKHAKRGSSSSLLHSEKIQEKVLIQSITLHDLLEQIGPDQVSLMKFDVEGAEEHIFADFRDFSQIERLAGELHHDLCDTTGFLETVKNQYNHTRLLPLKNRREYLLAENLK